MRRNCSLPIGGSTFAFAKILCGQADQAGLSSPPIVHFTSDTLMDFRSKQIAPPRDWPVFEDLCLALFRAEWSDPLALKNGRTGQPQHGVDVYGSPQSTRGELYGVQCKGKERNYGRKATIDEVRQELAKAEKFAPPLAHWIFATTAPKDASLQRAAREFSAERVKMGTFSITVLCWEDIQFLLARHPDVVEDFYPEHAYDIAGVLRALRELPSGEEVRDLREHIKRLIEPQQPNARRQDDGPWDLVSFEGQRDLGPALLGRGLGPTDATACPRLQEADMIVAQLRRAFSVRLVGGPGSGKSVCAYQAAEEFGAGGWIVRRLRDPREDAFPIPADDPCLLLVDDAHLMPRPALRRVEESANARRLVLSIHNGVEDGPLHRGAIVLDAKRAVRTIAAGLLLRPEQTLIAVRRADDDVGLDHLKEPLERRIDHAAAHSDQPWQFCFVLGGGWKRAKEAADAARVARTDLVLAAAAIIQLAARDAPLLSARLGDFCRQHGIADEDCGRAISWLAAQRLFLSDTDCRCPHQRFALAVLGGILDGQDELGRSVVGQMLSAAVREPSFPTAGLRILLHELLFLGHCRRWTRLVDQQALEPLIARGWQATSPEERAFAALLFSDLDAYVDGWYERLHQRVSTIGEWITTASPPAAYGLKDLMNALHNEHPHIAADIVNTVNPTAIAQAISNATPETADHAGELIRAIGRKRPDKWKSTFEAALRRERLVTLARSWPSTAPLLAFARFCSAITAWDDDLGLAMVEVFTPSARKAFADNPVSAFQALEDIADLVLRLSDPLGVYVGKFAPNRRRFALANAMCAELKPKILAAQLSETPRLDFQDATFFLAFLKKASNAKFRATVEAIDWPRIGKTVGENWANLSHQDEIFLTVSYSSGRARGLIAAMVAEHLESIEKFPLRLAVMMPEVAIRHIEAGKRVRFSQHQHFEFQFGAIFLAQLSKLRPDLVEPALAPFENFAGEALSGQNSSWFRDAALFVEVLREIAPVSLQRILSAVDVQKAEAGWLDSLSRPGSAQDAVARLIETAFARDDAVGELARRLRRRYPSRSRPKKQKNHLRM
ncbi:hypothetical protein SAMN02745172_01436 [Pseudoxanthobacter soli DSM 19599]|uniref:Restriction endonuclease n=1 Tax=Pseudoxanthobacter soli DSM 19599 TaxID=1123029 RepID=A0A1M7ZF93_9HYPH|nr:restriction endonuclease [Pseudoxanthobacter soli]SHO63570.1 hypothetical protein SAMN02745172_01436 [Pseudoxanthobacter soli DSM 19599]